MSEVCLALGCTAEQINFPDANTHPLCSALFARKIIDVLAERLGADRVLDAELVGQIGTTKFNTFLTDGLRIEAQWTVSQRSAGKPDTNAALKAAAKREYEKHVA